MKLTVFSTAPIPHPCLFLFLSSPLFVSVLLPLSYRFSTLFSHSHSPINGMINVNLQPPMPPAMCRMLQVRRLKKQDTHPSWLRLIIIGSSRGKRRRATWDFSHLPKAGTGSTWHGPITRYICVLYSGHFFCCLCLSLRTGAMGRGSAVSVFFFFFHFPFSLPPGFPSVLALFFPASSKTLVTLPLQTRRP